MNWLEKLLRNERARDQDVAELQRRNAELVLALRKARATPTIELEDPGWTATREALRVRLAAAPEDDALLRGILGWQDRMLAEKIRQCDDATLTPERALSLCHQMAQIAAFRTELELTWQQERAKALQPS